MRTSTVVFLVLFLCLFSSRERRGKISSVIHHIKSEIHSATDGHFSESCKRDAVPEDSEVTGLRSELRELDQRDEAANKTLRTIDRSVRALDERIRKLEHELKRQPQFGEVFRRSLGLLVRQRTELKNEREEILGLKERMAGETIRIQAEIDLAQIRSERRQVESFLKRERGSPVDQLAEEEGAASF
ncbi:MAG: hypothetical protein V2A76_18380 [Planctomycetota bacterium]